MHIYTQEEFECRLKEIIKTKLYKPVSLKPYYAEQKVIKNYIYYDEPFKII